MEKGNYVKNTRKIIDLVDGMTDVQWSKIQTLINRCIDEKKAKVTFEKPEHLDLLMKQNFITGYSQCIELYGREMTKVIRQAVLPTTHDNGGEAKCTEAKQGH